MHLCVSASPPQRELPMAPCRARTGLSTWRSATSSTRPRKGKGPGGKGHQGEGLCRAASAPHLPSARSPIAALLQHKGRPCLWPLVPGAPQRLYEPHPRQEQGLLNMWNQDPVKPCHQMEERPGAAGAQPAAGPWALPATQPLLEAFQPTGPSQDIT